MRSGILGEATVNMKDYMSTSESVPVSLSLKKCSHGTTLQVSPQFYDVLLFVSMVFGCLFSLFLAGFYHFAGENSVLDAKNKIHVSALECHAIFQTEFDVWYSILIMILKLFY